MVQLSLDALQASLLEVDMKAKMLERQRLAEEEAEAAALAKVSAEAKKKAAAAMRALAKITAKDINYVKVLKKPPIMIQRVMDVVAILFNGKLEKVSVDKDHKARRQKPELIRKPLPYCRESCSRTLAGCSVPPSFFLGGG